MILERDNLPSFLIFVSSFAGFYFTIEAMLFANRNIFGPTGAWNDAVMFLISFLNLAPAGIFGFSIISALPRKLCSNYTEERVMEYTPLKAKTRTAILYTSYNDFLPEYAKYDNDQARELGVPFFILDDSTSRLKQGLVDRFASENGCKVVRRTIRKGFKAGAINNWIKLYGEDYDYIFILDSDSQASCSSIRCCLELARRDPRLGLIQTKTLTMTSSPSKMTVSNVTIQHAYMAIVQNAMKNMGTSPYYGHNALVKLEALKAVGGFIEESNEDYKTLARVHNAGYRSLYASSAVTWEEIPPDYFSARKRALRWSRDSVGQLGLLRFRGPFAMMIYLIYGWATYMANLAMVSLFLLLAVRTLSIQISNMGVFGEIAGLMTMIVIILWPLLSIRVKGSNLNVKSILSAVAWGTFFSMPMSAPVSLQILRTSFSRIKVFIKNAIGLKSYVVEEFIVTPKVRSEGRTFHSIISDLRIELMIGAAPFVLAITTGSFWFLLFSLVQIISLVFLPTFLYSESRPNKLFFSMDRHTPISAKEYARGSRLPNVTAMPQVVSIVAN